MKDCNLHIRLDNALWRRLSVRLMRERRRNPEITRSAFVRDALRIRLDAMDSADALGGDDAEKG